MDVAESCHPFEVGTYKVLYIYRYNVQGRKTSSQSRTFAQRLAILERGVLDYHVLLTVVSIRAQETLHPGVMILA
jgi:hypothetical protein